MELLRMLAQGYGDPTGTGPYQVMHPVTGETMPHPAIQAYPDLSPEGAIRMWNSTRSPAPAAAPPAPTNTFGAVDQLLREQAARGQQVPQ